MKRNLLIFFSCIGICLCAYRFGDIGWKDAKGAFAKGVHERIMDVMLPAVSLYDAPKSYPMYRDIGLFVMPALGTMGQEEAWQTKGVQSAKGEPTQDAVSKGAQATETIEGVQTTGGEATSEGAQATEGESGQEGTQGTQGESEQEGTQVAQGEPASEDGQATQEEVLPAGALAGLEKQVVINRQKLQDFDYLRQNFYQIDSSTTIGSDQLQADKLLAKDLHLKENVQGPQILIYHTHSQEGYKDSVAGDASTSVVAVGEYLTQLLTEQYGLQVMHHKGEYDVNDRADSYSNALPAVEQLLKENPTIEVVIDLHRDGVPETTHLVTELSGKPTAQIMFFNGLSRTTSRGELGYLPNPYIADNLAFSLQMQLAAEEYFPGLTRRIYLKGYRYNMHLCPKTLLVEVGAQTNTFAEAKNAMEPLAALLGYVLKY